MFLSHIVASLPLFLPPSKYISKTFFFKVIANSAPHSMCREAQNRRQWKGFLDDESLEMVSRKSHSVF